MDFCVRAVRAQELQYKYVTKRGAPGAPTRLTDPMAVDYDQQQRLKGQYEDDGEDVNVYSQASHSMMSQQDQRSLDQLRSEAGRRQAEALAHENIARV
jgi:hypothetical protein